MYYNANCFVCSHNATAERQFRYPIEYGVNVKKQYNDYRCSQCNS
ncbi:MAG: hypothetical protein ACLRWM_03315 [Streptococcus sp.]